MSRIYGFFPLCHILKNCYHSKSAKYRQGTAQGARVMILNFDSIMEFLQNFETAKVVATLEKLNLQALIRNPYFLGGTGALAILSLIMRWRLLLAVILIGSGFVALLAYTFEQGTSLEGGMANDSLMVFIGGGAVLVFLMIYLLFIRGE